MSCCERTCSTRCSCDCHGFTPAAAGVAAAARLSSMWDRARDMETRAGLRPYRVAIVRARATGLRSRGDGPTEVVAEWLLLPTPKVSDLTSLTEVLNPDQLRESGSVLLSGISLAYPESVLLGRGESGSPIPAGEVVFFEIAYLDRAGRVSARRKFVAGSAPNANAARAEWTVSLMRAPWDRDQTGALR